MAQLAVITDEISTDLRHALDVCTDLGISVVELRVVNNASIVDHDIASLHEIKAMLDAGGFTVCNIASPFLKTHIGDGSDTIGATHGAKDLHREQHWDVLKRSLEVAHLLNVPMVRAFSFWRVTDPESVREDILETLQQATEITRDAGKLLGLENEYACNIGSGTEAAWYLERITDPSLQLIWDPGNIAALGVVSDHAEHAAVANRIGHVHVKDGNAIPADHFVVPGEGVCDWENQLRWLHQSGYDGPLSLETHFALDGSIEAGTRVIAAALRDLAARAGMPLDA
ncbi:MAG: sugar phosphate isomerase/epimerase [Thermomicrobiales bacterium]|nr:sugar phosphate isomerase/epimerase [Thermomicrobiales bacterium]